jgi:hypothetical protein
VVSRADEYRRRAQQCLETAATFRDRDARLALSHMAQVWLRLAERNDLMPPVATAQAQPAFQQQQQVQPKQASSTWARWESVTKIFSDFALFSGVVAVLRYHARGCDLAHLERVRPIRRVRVL